MGTQTACNTLSLTSDETKKIKKLLKKLRDEALKGDFGWGELSSIVDSCTFLIEMLEGKQ